MSRALARATREEPRDDTLDISGPDFGETPGQALEGRPKVGVTAMDLLESHDGPLWLCCVRDEAGAMWIRLRAHTVEAVVAELDVMVPVVGTAGVHWGLTPDTTSIPPVAVETVTGFVCVRGKNRGCYPITTTRPAG